jgi:hypothetical protein
MSDHHCHARNCSTAVPPELLMCAKHWRMVPKPMQQDVWRNYRRGQCDDMRPSRAWHDAADAAITFVAKKEAAARAAAKPAQVQLALI